MAQELLLLQKISQEQLLSQKFSCETMMKFLSAAEKCVDVDYKIGGGKYRFYDKFNSASFKNQEQLERELRNELRCFQPCFLTDVEEGGYRYPDNLNREQIENDIINYIKIAKRQGKRNVENTLKSFLDLLKYEKQIQIEIVKNNKSSKKSSKNGICGDMSNSDANQLMEDAMKMNHETFEMEKKFIDDYNKGDTSLKVQLFKDYPKKPKKSKGFFGWFGGNNEDDYS